MATGFDELYFHDVGEGRKGDFYKWATSHDFSDMGWNARIDSFKDTSYLMFRWERNTAKDCEVALVVDLEQGTYRVCNVLPTVAEQFTPSEYNAAILLFENNILNKYNAEEGNHIMITHEKGPLTYVHGGDIKDNFTDEEFQMDMLKALAIELGRGRMELMGDVYNRYTHEIMDMASFSRIVNQIVEIVTQQLMRPGNCNLLMAAQCFVATCMKKQVPDSNMFDVFLGEEFQKELSTFVNVDYGALYNAIQVGNVHVDLEALYANAR